MLFVGILNSVPSVIGQEHEVLLCDKLKEKNLSFLSKSFFDLHVKL